MNTELFIHEVKSILEEDKCAYFFREKDSTFTISTRCPGLMGRCQVFIYINKTSIVTYAPCPLSADPRDPKRMQKVSEFLHRLNSEMRPGGFILNPDTGEVGYRIYIDCTHALPSQAVIRNSIQYPLEMLRWYGEGIGYILFHGSDVWETLRRCSDAHCRGVPTWSAFDDGPLMYLGDSEDEPVEFYLEDDEDSTDPDDEEDDSAQTDEAEIFDLEETLRSLGLLDDFGWNGVDP